MIYRRYLKRIFDLLGAMLFGVVIFPFAIILLIVLCVEHQGRPFFFQERPGLRGRCFRIVKFRTMVDGKDSEQSDEERVTRLGNVLRKSSLDELPQLWNIVVGEMSWIGPRPLLKKYLPLYSQEQQKRHLLLPGITGLAQVSGRKSLDWSKRFELDVQYVENCSFILDVKILKSTVVKVIQRDKTDEDQEWLGN